MDKKNNKKRLFLLDAYALIFRGYYAFSQNARIDSKGRDVSAFFGFAMILEDIVERSKADYIAVVFDPAGGSAERKELFTEYKANRPDTPEPIVFARPYIDELLEIYQIPKIVKTGYEADDVIATLAKKAATEDIDVYMVTSDKDFGQVVDENIHIYRPRSKGGGYDVWGVEEVNQKFDISNPRQVIDFLALSGDAVDNIPGAKGIGPKTASKLIAQYGGVEAIIDAIPTMKGKMKENLENSIDNIRLSYKLATIDTNVPVDLDMESMKGRPIQVEKLKALFKEFEIRTLLPKILENNAKRYQGESVEFVGNHTDESENEKYTNFNSLKFILKSLDNNDILQEFIDKVRKANRIKIAVLPLRSEYIDSEMHSLAFSVAENDIFYTLEFSASLEDDKKSLYAIKSILEDEKIEKVGYDLKKIKHLFAYYDINLAGLSNDIMLAHYLLNSDLSHSLDFIAKGELDYTVMDFKEIIIPQKENDYDLNFVDPKLLSDYLSEQIFLVSILDGILINKLKKDELINVFFEIEMPLIDVLYSMERVGVAIDKDEIKRQEQELNEKLEGISNDIYSLAGKNININSPKQIGELLFDELKVVEKAPKTKTGQYKTGEEELKAIEHTHPIIPKILQYRTLSKLLSTYLSTLPLYLHKDARIHAKYNQAVAATGRLSSSDPNIQNIPIRTEEGRHIRAAFVPSKGNIFLSADYSQIELRLMAELSEDKNLMEAFLNNEDVHSSTASKIYNIPIEFVNSDQRRMAKTANFGIIYGISTFGLSERLSIPYKDAKELIKTYFETYPAVESYMNKQIDNARKDSFVSTITGRKRYIKDIHSTNSNLRSYAERNAINAPLQGSAADIIKLAMIDIYRKMTSAGMKSKMIVQVHDELNFDVVPEELEAMKELIRSSMENIMPNLKVPLLVEVGEGDSWLEAH